jgi:hypothetical protein
MAERLAAAVDLDALLAAAGVAPQAGIEHAGSGS